MFHKNLRCPVDLNFDELINIDLNRANRRLQRLLYREVLEPAGFSVQEWRALLNLAKHGPCHIRELARASTLDATQLSRAAARLQKRGLVLSKSDAGDARRKILVVSPAGEKVVADIWPKAIAFSGRIRDALGAGEYQALQRALKRVREIEPQTRNKIAAE